MARKKTLRTPGLEVAGPPRPRAAFPELSWPDPDQILLDVDEDDWQDVLAADQAAREHFESHTWE